MAAGLAGSGGRVPAKEKSGSSLARAQLLIVMMKIASWFAGDKPPAIRRQA